MMGDEQADKSSGPASSHPHQEAKDMTAPETFTVPSKRPLNDGAPSGHGSFGADSGPS